MPVTLFWARHGTSYSNVVSVLRDYGQPVNVLLQEAEKNAAYPPGHSDLTPLGRMQAVEAGRYLRGAGAVPDAIMCSSLPRAIETADGMRAGLGIDTPLLVAPYIQELRNSARTGREVRRFAATQHIDTVSTDMLDDAPPGHKPNLDLFYDAVDRAALPPDARVLVVSHGNFLQQVTGGHLMWNTEIYRSGVHGAATFARHVYSPAVNTHTLGGMFEILRMAEQGALSRPFM
jgi:broad specificity phosphatase PhoE